jgi:Flp pilus assembly protein TadG
MKFSPTRSDQTRRGAATAEFAVMVPLLWVLFSMGVDFARAYYAHLIITNAARDGALYGSDTPTTAADTAGIKAMALRDTGDLSGVTVTPATTTTNGVTYLSVNVTYPFSTVTPVPFIPSTLTINRTCIMRIEPTTPYSTSP